MGASRRMEQLKYRFRGTERKESELNHSFPVICAPWHQHLLLVIWLMGMPEVRAIPAACAHLLRRGEALLVPAAGLARHPAARQMVRGTPAPE